jgi:hypothetical protein
MAKKNRASNTRTKSRQRPARSERAGRRRSAGARASQRVAPVFVRRNYVLLAVGAALLALGYTLMALDGSLDGFVALTLAPLTIAAGYAAIVWGVLHRGARKDEDARAQQAAA